MNSIATNFKLGRYVYAFVLAMLMLTPSLASAQTGRVNQYTMQTFSSAYVATGGTNLGTGDDLTFNTTLPFAFNYDNVNRAAGTAITVTTNGFMSFQTGIGTSLNDIVGISTYQNSIAICSEDMYVTGGVLVSTTGSAPNRVFRVEWSSTRAFSGTGTLVNFQIRLYETTNVIEFWYSSLNTALQTGSNLMGFGLNGVTSPSFTSLRYGSQSLSTPSSNVRFTPPVLFDMRAAVSPESISFGTVAYTEFSPEFNVTVTNLGLKDNLLITGAVVSGTADFTVTSSPASNVIPPGGSAIYKLRFSPLAAFTRTGMFTVATNGLDSGTQSVNLTGFGLAPAVSFPENLILFRKTRTRLGQSLTQAIPVTSSGNGPLTITGIQVNGEFAPMYTWTRKLSGPIPPGVTDTVFVKFTALEEGLRPADITIMTNAVQNFPNATYKMNGMGILPRLYMTPEIVRFDSTAMGDTAWTTIRLTNPGTDTLAVRADYVTYFDRDFTYFGLEGADSLIYPETYRDVQVRFTPQMRGSRQGRVRFTTNIPLTMEDPRRDTSVYIIDVQGIGVPFGLISLEGPTTIDSVIIGTESCETVMIWNNGQSPLTVNSATLVGVDAADFTLTGITFPAQLAPGGKLTAQLCATPSARGPRTATLEVNAISNDKSSVTQLPVAVHGLLVCATPSTNIAFENEIVLVNTTTSAQITVTNCGDVPSVYTATIDNASYQLTSPATTASILPGENATFDVTFMPTIMGDAAGTLTITSTGVPAMPITLDGIGGNVMIQAENTTAPETAVAATSPQFDVTVTNIGNMELTPGDPTVSNSAFAYVAGSGPSTIAAGGSGTYKFTFTPPSAGTHTANVTFTGASPSLAGGFMLTGSTPTGAVRPVAMNGYALGQNYPNPFNPSTTITFTMAESGNAQIIVSDVTGNIVATVADQFFAQGENKVTFDASNVASGTYFYELVANGIRLQRSMLLNK